jgi:hypothetical protein
MSKKPAQSQPQKRQRLWIITESGFYDAAAGGLKIKSLAEALAADFEVNLLCRSDEFFGFWSARTPEIGEVKVSRCAKGIWPVSVFFKSLKNFRPGEKVLLVISSPGLASAAATSAALIKGASYTLFIAGNDAEGRPGGKNFKSNSIGNRALALIDRWIYKYASKIIVCSKELKVFYDEAARGLDVPTVLIPAQIGARRNAKTIKDSARFQSGELSAETEIYARLASLLRSEIWQRDKSMAEKI